MLVKKHSIENIINKIKKGLIKEGLYDKDSIILDKPKTKDESLIIIENEIEKGLITSRDYANPTTFLPLNPYSRLLKKLVLFVIKVYTKSQIVFNQNILYSANKLYQYVLHISEKLKNNDLKNHQEIKELEKRVKILEKQLKSNA